MGRTPSTFVPRAASLATALLLLLPLLLALHLEVTDAARPRQRGTTERDGSPPRGGSVNEAGVFALRGRQEGSRRTRRTTTTTTTAATATTTTTTTTIVAARGVASPESLSLSSTPLAARIDHPLVISDDDEDEEDVVVRPAALLAPDEPSWPTDASLAPEMMGSTRAEIKIIVKPQRKVELPCELNSNYSKLLLPASRSYRVRPATWLHDGNAVDMITIDTRTEMSGTGHRYIGDSTTAALHIDNVRLEDDGTWSCTLEDDRGKILLGRPVKLVVLEAPRATYLLIDGRRLDPGNQFVPVKEGSELTLECGVEGGNPPPVITWGMTLSQATLDGPEQPPNNLTVLPSVAGRSSGAHLNVLRGHHNATIACIARHDTLAAPMNASILLDVQYTPAFAITRLPGFGIPIVEGMSMGLKCEVDSNPSSVPVWQRDDAAPPVEQSDDGWLNFTKITREESGWYKCYTRHMLGIFTSVGYFLNVRYDPDIETEAEALNGEATDTRKIEVQLGGAVTLECDGGCWGRGPGMEPVGGPGPLALSRVVYQEAGEYRCVAPDRKMQDTWRAQIPYSIKVTGGPVVRPKVQTVSASEGQPLDLAVEFCAEPSYTRVLWFSEERVYAPGSQPLAGVRALVVEDGKVGACHESVLRFDKVGWSHAGEWTMLVRSPAGITDAIVALNVTRGTASEHENAAATAVDHRSSRGLRRLVLFLTSFSILYAAVCHEPSGGWTSFAV